MLCCKYAHEYAALFARVSTGSSKASNKSTISRSWVLQSSFEECGNGRGESVAFCIHYAIIRSSNCLPHTHTHPGPRNSVVDPWQMSMSFRFRNRWYRVCSTGPDMVQRMPSIFRYKTRKCRERARECERAGGRVGFKSFPASTDNGAMDGLEQQFPRCSIFPSQPASEKTSHSPG